MGLAAERAEEHAALLRLAAGGFRDMTRIASGHPGIWLDICAENRDAIISGLDGLIDGLRHVRNVVRDDDYRTNVDNVWVCGDMGRGQSLIVWAIAEGRACAAAVDRSLMGETLLPAPIPPTAAPIR